MVLDKSFVGEQTHSLRLEVAKALLEAAPNDLETVDLSGDKGLTPEWRDWGRTETICRRLGAALGERIVREGCLSLRHRHLQNREWTLPAIDLCLKRGDLPDWRELFASIGSDPSLGRCVLARALLCEEAGTRRLVAVLVART